MRKHLMTILLAAILLIPLVSCESQDSPVRVGSDVDLLVWEAERAVILFGHQPEDVPALVAEIAQDLKRIRERFGGWLDIDGHRVHFPWSAFRCWVGLTDEGVALFESGNWPEFDSALADCGADSMVMDGRLGMVHYANPTSPCVVGRALADVEHVTGFAPRWWSGTCEDPCGFIWPIPTATGMDYLFEYRNDGDCGSEFEELPVYHYFRADDRRDVQLVGSYHPRQRHDIDERPDWLLQFDRYELYGCSD